MRVSLSLLVTVLVTVLQPSSLQSRRSTGNGQSQPTGLRGGGGGNRRGTLPLPHPFAAGGGGVGTLSELGPSGLPLSGRNGQQGYYDSEESKYALWGGSGTPEVNQGSRKKDSRGRRPSGGTPRKPNIILMLADDQDIELGSMNFMPKTLRILGEGGAHFPNAYVTTPMCCPSRSSMLTGLYVHNHNVYTNNDNCSSLAWQQEHEPHTFATYLNNAGYRTAFFGKYLNEYNGSYIPPGWREWAALVRNSRFYNYTINVNGNKIKHNDNYYADYYPDLIANDSIAFLRQSKQYFVHKPVLMVLSFPTPHGPEDSAPQYQNLFHNITTHRTPSWNFAPNPDKQWLLRHTRKMEPIHMKFTDMLHTKRLQTLQSVDETIGRLYQELVNLGEVDNTYLFYTSDHGYHLGQFGLVKGKSMPFEFDVRVPFYVRGPRVPQGVRISKIVLNVDLAPTFLDIGGVDVPEHMDGKSILPLIMEAANATGSAGYQNPRRRQWRDSFLIERGKVSSKEYGYSGLKMTKEERLKDECQRPEYKSPCQPYQKWECVYDDSFRWRIRKCRHHHQSQFQQGGSGMQGSYVPRSVKNNCVCPEDSYPSSEMDDLFEQYAEAQQKRDEHILLSRKRAQIDPLERRLQRRFLKEHVSKDFNPVFIGSRPRRDLVSVPTSPVSDFDVEGVYLLSRLLDLTVDSTEGSNSSLLDYNDYEEAEEKDYQSDGVGDDGEEEEGEEGHHLVTRSVGGTMDLAGTMVAGGCFLWPNNSISCPESVYRDPRLWREKKERLDNLIKKLQQKLGELKDIRKHLKRKRPNMFSNVLTEPGRPQQCRCDYMDDTDYSRQSEQREHLREERQRLKEERLHKKERKLRRKAKFEHTNCNLEKMNCFSHDNDHWKTPPLWTDGPFCFCQNSNNNTYWCMRTINVTHNFLYCEFITGFITFYDLRVDPYQLRNAVYDLDFPMLEELRKQLNMLRSCKGARECHIQFRTEPPRRNQHVIKDDIRGNSHNHRHWQRRRRWPNEERRRFHHRGHK